MSRSVMIWEKFKAEKRRNASNAKGKRRKRFTEGWVEFKDKSLAKRVAASLNNTAVGGKRRSAARETLWTMKYLSRLVLFYFRIFSIHSYTKR